MFGVSDDPVKHGLVASLARPSGNLTGINIFTAELTAKRLGIMRELIPGAARGFGKAIALRLAREGVEIVVNYRRSMSDAQAVVDEINAQNGRFL